MLFIYRILINLVILISPIIIALKLIIKKRTFLGLKKNLFFSKKKLKGQLIWFHGASVGELQSIFPLLEIRKKK